MNIEKNKVLAIAEILSSLVCSLVFLFFIDLSLRIVCIYGLIITIYLLLVYYQVTKKFLSPFILFYFSFCIFQFGQYYLYALNIDYEYVFFHPFYSQFFSDSDIITVAKFTIVSIQLLIMAGVITFRCRCNSDRECYVSVVPIIGNNVDSLKKTAGILLVISFPCAMLVTISEVIVSVLYGYTGIRSGISGSFIASLSIFNKLSVFYVPSLFLNWILYNNERRIQITFEVLMVIHSAAYLLVGQRTIGLALAMVFILLKLEKKERTNVRVLCALGLMFVFLMAISNFVGDTRNNSGVSLELFEGFFSSIINFVGDCGWSCFPFLVISGSCPGEIAFSNGYSYFASVLGFFPSFLDPTGTISRLVSSVDEAWLTDYVGFDFGIGYSLTAEAFYNYAWFGLIPIFIISLLISSFLSIGAKRNSLFRYYTQIALTYGLFTLPRRGVYHFFNLLFYYVFIFWIIYMAISVWQICKHFYLCEEEE